MSTVFLRPAYAFYLRIYFQQFATFLIPYYYTGYFIVLYIFSKDTEKVQYIYSLFFKSLDVNFYKPWGFPVIHYGDTDSKKMW